MSSPCRRIRMACCAICGFEFRWQRKAPDDEHALQRCPNCLGIMPGFNCTTRLVEPPPNLEPSR